MYVLLPFFAYFYSLFNHFLFLLFVLTSPYLLFLLSFYITFLILFLLYHLTSFFFATSSFSTVCTVAFLLLHLYTVSHPTFSSTPHTTVQTLKHKETGEELSLKEASLRWRSRLADTLNILQSEASDGELAALISFAIAFPCGLVALVDTYDVLK